MSAKLISIGTPNFRGEVSAVWVATDGRRNVASTVHLIPAADLAAMSEEDRARVTGAQASSFDPGAVLRTATPLDRAEGAISNTQLYAWDGEARRRHLSREEAIREISRQSADSHDRGLLVAAGIL